MSAAALRRAGGALLLDVLLVAVFAATGRASHDSDVLAGLWSTACPFLAALALGWLISAGWRRPTAVRRTGVPVWIVTVAGGMLLRAVSGQGIALAFVIVATIVLGLLLIGWRFIAAAIVRRRRTKRAARP